MQKKVLVIDDDRSICEVIEILLQGKGYDVKVLPNGNNLEEELHEYFPHLLIVDYLMPGKNGAEITRYMRGREDAKTMPIIMIAANQRYRNESLKAGVNVFLNKPFDIYELLALVQKSIQNGIGGTH